MGQRLRRRVGRAALPGFTLLELLVVLTLIAIAVGMVSLSLRDADADRLEQEAARLSALLEGARARSRAMGSALRWQPSADGSGFRFIGLPKGVEMPQRWLDDATRATVVGAPELRLGPEPILDAQQVVLRLGNQQLRLATDGLGAFTRQDEPAARSP